MMNLKYRPGTYKNRIPRKCSFGDCVGYAISKGYCEKHYKRLLRTGTPEWSGKVGRGCKGCKVNSDREVIG